MIVARYRPYIARLKDRHCKTEHVNNLKKLLLTTAFLLGTGALAKAGGTPEAASHLAQPEGPVLLEVSGNITRKNHADSAVFDRDMLAVLTPAYLETSTAVTDGVHHFEGFLLRDLMAMVGASGETITAAALNEYIIDITMEEAEKFDIVVATRMDGLTLSPSGKGPLWIIYPRDQHPELQDIRYDYRWVWQLKSLEIK